MTTVQQQSPSCQVIQQQEMHNMGYSSLTPNNTGVYGHVHSNQSCGAPGSVEAMDVSGGGGSSTHIQNLESPHSIQSVSSVDTNHPHGPGSVENYQHHHSHQQQMQQHQQAAMYHDSCKYGSAHSPMIMNPPTPQPTVSKPPTPQSKFSFRFKISFF